MRTKAVDISNVCRKGKLFRLRSVKRQGFNAS